MASVHSVIVWSVFSALSIGLLGQTNGCNIDALINVIFQPSGGNNDATSDGFDDNGGDSGDELRMKALLTGADPSHGNAEYRRKGTRFRLKVELEAAPVDSTHDVVVAGVFIGTLTIGPLGQGELEFDTQPEPGHLPWPADLPTELEAGTLIQVGSASGALGT